MRKERPSMTARKVAANIVTLGQLPEMSRVLPLGLVETTAEVSPKQGVEFFVVATT